MTFAYIYDQLMSDIDYQLIFDFIKPYIKNKDVIIDAGCGTGYLTEILAHNHQVIGLDIDSDMLTIARNRCESLGLDVQFYEHDIKDEIPLRVDAIISMFDVINFNQDEFSIFKSFYDALNDKGICILDIYKEEVLDVYQNYDESEDLPIPYTWHISVKDDTMTHQLDCLNQTYEMIQYVKPLAYYLNIIKQIGFKYQVTDGPDERKYYLILEK